MSKENIGSYELKTKLSEILRRVRAGESFTITNRGKPVADLLPSKTASRQKMAAAIDNILRVSKTTVPVSDDRLEGYKKEGCKRRDSSWIIQWRRTGSFLRSEQLRRSLFRACHSQIFNAYQLRQNPVKAAKEAAWNNQFLKLSSGHATFMRICLIRGFTFGINNVHLTEEH